jgi:hypothetical protein
MLSIEQMTIVAYLGDGFIVCRECGEKDGMPARDALCAYSVESDFSEDGLCCDECSKVIVEPYVEEPEDEEEEPEEDEDA